MKYRNGLVSNSSSSSFLIYGVCLDQNKVTQTILEKYKDRAIEIANKSLADNEKYRLEHIRKDPKAASWFKQGRIKPYTAEDINEFFEDGEALGNFLPVQHITDYGECYLGRSWDSIEDNETGAQFKARVREEIDSVMGPGLNYASLEHAWYS